MIQPFPRRGLRRAAAASLIAVLALSASPAALAAFPAKGAGGDDSDPYAYGDYMFLGEAQFPPSDLGGDIWKYSSKTACELYFPPNAPPEPRFDPEYLEELHAWAGQRFHNCNPAIENNPQELFGVTGASIDKAWETTSGRPDVVIAVHDSGIRWNDPGAMNDLRYKTWLNRGELPLPDWGTPHPNDPYDRNADGVFNLEDLEGDSRLSDLNDNGFIDPEDVIFRFSDGIDQDGNGYVDDFVGWDSYEDDNDPYDEVDYGHGTGEARDSTAEIDNGGDAGVCPNCMVMHMRVGNSFIADVNDFAQGVLYATDNGASVIQSALGTLNNSRFAQEAIDYAWRRGVILIASAADESAGHHNQPSVLEKAVTLNSIGEPERLDDAQPAGIASYLEFRGCTNYGAYITAAVPSNSCSSEAVGRTAGMAGLIYAAARNAVAKGALDDYGVLDGDGGVGAGKGLSAEEVDQIIKTTADDIDFTGYTARPDLAHSERYPATQGWDPFFGFGRVNAQRMVQAVSEGMIPPEAEITSPVWFATIDPDDGPIEIEGLVASRRSQKFSYEVSWAPWSWRDANTAPLYSTTGVSLNHAGVQTAPIDGTLATIDASAVEEALLVANGPHGTFSGPAVDPVTGRGDHENRQIPDKFGIIVSLEVTALNDAGEALTDIDGEDLMGIARKNFNFHDDPALFEAFPIDLEGDGAAAPRFADLDDDGADEMVVATSNGEIHAYRVDGTELPGWPVFTTPQQLNYGAPAYSSGEITKPGGSVRSAVLRSPAIGDLDRDGDLEVVVGDFQGRVSAFAGSGEMLPGFPVRSDPHYSGVQKADREAGYYAAHPELVPSGLPNDPDLVPDVVDRRNKLNDTNWWFLAAPSLGNLDPADDDLEILAGAGDRHLYAWHSDGTPVEGWPVMLRDPAHLGSVDPVTHAITNAPDIDRLRAGQIVTSVALGDVDGNGDLEVAATVNEQYVETPNTDDPAIPQIVAAAGLDTGNNRLYLLHEDGAAHGSGDSSQAHPHEQAYVAGWPARIADLALEILPLVGDGPDGAPVLGNVNGGDDLEIGIIGTVGPGYILGPDGMSIYGRDDQGRDRTLMMAATGPGTNSPDAPSVPAVGGGIFVDLGDGTLSFALPAAGLGKLVDLGLPEDQLLSDNHLAIWATSGPNARAQQPAFPREVNDLQFLTTPAAADLDGDGLQEVLEGTAYSDLHAFNVAGNEPGMRTLADDGWPKFTGGWTVAPPAVGDFDGDGERDVAHSIREGRLFAWRGNGASVCDPATWPEFGHDNWNTNNAEFDATRPGRIHDLAASSGPGGVVTLTWTAPGDDGTCGRAAAYDLRSSATELDGANFRAAEPVEGEPAPSEAGSAESITLPAPACDTYFALRSFDLDPAGDAPGQPANPSAASNSVLVEGTDPAVCAPTAPTELALTGDTQGQATDPATLGVRLSSEGTPVPDAPVFLTFQDVTHELVTAGDGTASVTVALDGPARTAPLSAAFTGSETLEPSSASLDFVVLHEDAALLIEVPPRERGRDKTTAIRARLTDADSDAGWGGRTIEFAIEGDGIGSGETDGQGWSVLETDRKLRDGDDVSASFAGDGTFSPAAVTVTYDRKKGASGSSTAPVSAFAVWPLWLLAGAGLVVGRLAFGRRRPRG